MSNVYAIVDELDDSRPSEVLMPFPRFLQPQSAAGGAKPVPAVTAMTGRGTPAVKLAFPLQRQVQSNWCWAAVTASVSAFYRSPSPWTQCEVADAALGRQDCCTTGSSDPSKCNRPFYLETALDITGHLAKIATRSLTIAEVQRELTNGRPLCARVEWTDRTGHFLALVGCVVGASGDAYLDVSDPIYLESQIPFRDFATSYQTGASWTHSYFTIGAAMGGAALAMSQPQTPLYPDAIGA